MRNLSGHRIFVIENQKYQFREILDHLRLWGFEVFPNVPGEGENSENTFIPLMDAVRIFLNLSYSGKKSQDARNRIHGFIEGFQPELFIVDHVLVGSYDSKTGTYLARQLLADYGKPIVFLSRTDPTKDREIREDLEYLSKNGHLYEWVGKGFSGGLPILNRTYFERYVIEPIAELLDKSEQKRLFAKIDELITQNYKFDHVRKEEDKKRLFEVLNDLKEKGSTDVGIVKCIMNFDVTVPKTNREIQEFLDQFLSLTGPS